MIDAFVGSEIVLHVKKDAKIESERMKKVLDDVGIKMKTFGEDASKLFPKPKKAGSKASA